MIKATRFFFFFDVDTSNCKAMISMIKATRFFSSWFAHLRFILHFMDIWRKLDIVVGQGIEPRSRWRIGFIWLIGVKIII